MGRPRKPVEVKKAQGTLQASREPTPLAAVEILPTVRERLIASPPAGLQDAGIELWQQVWSEAISWIMPDSDMAMVKSACQLADARQIAFNRYCATTDPSDARALKALDEQYQRALSLCGFSPSDRSRLGLTAAKTESKLDQLRRRRAEGSA